MSTAIRSSQIYKSGLGGADPQYTLTVPACQVGDVLVAHLMTNGTGATTFTGPAGWTKLRTDAYSGLGSVASCIWWKLAIAGDTGGAATYRFQSSYAGAAAGGIVAVSGGDLTTPINTHSGAANNDTVAAPSVTTTVTNCMLLFFCGEGGVYTFTPPGGMTELYDGNSEVGAGEVSVELAWEQRGLAGATGTRTCTPSGAYSMTAALVAIAPAVHPMLKGAPPSRAPFWGRH